MRNPLSRLMFARNETAVFIPVIETLFDYVIVHLIQQTSCDGELKILIGSESVEQLYELTKVHVTVIDVLEIPNLNSKL